MKSHAESLKPQKHGHRNRCRLFRGRSQQPARQTCGLCRIYWPRPASESYLDIDAIIGAAKKWQADAIHPGYGFLSENPKLAKACSENGIVFIGPSTSAIEAMGSKSQAKAIMSEANVPLVPGYHGTDNSVEHLLAEAEKSVTR